MIRSVRFYIKRFFQTLLALLILIFIGITILFFAVTSPPEENAASENVINDVTGINPITVAKIYKPHSVEEIKQLVESHDGTISIGGARHSMGGQIGLEKSLHLDMREFDQVISFSADQKEVTVQAGITWRKIQEYIDPHNLSVMIMQTYADFTVGGSLSVNVHGRYIGHGPLIHSVKSIQVVLPNGELVTASPEENSEIFYGCIGGYGGLGVIVEATLRLADNSKVERQSTVMPAKDYYNYFVEQVRNDTAAIFHNGDIYPYDYNEIRAVSYVQTDAPVTIEDRLRPLDKNYRLERFAMWTVSEVLGGNWLRQHVAEPILYSREQVSWRNYEASYDALQLEPTSRRNSTYVLQEYFVPVDSFQSFVPRMTAIFREHDVNVINISIRHARPDTLSLLRWAPTEVFCFVVYYKQGTAEEDKKEVGIWTRKLIDAALEDSGSYYLPYQLHATEEQFQKAYPDANKFFELKKRLDPSNKFRNKLWDKYYKS